MHWKHNLIVESKENDCNSIKQKIKKKQYWEENDEGLLISK